MINVSRVVNNPKFAQPFTITRSTLGGFDDSGKWSDTPETVAMFGIIYPATPKELDQVPDGDRVKEVKSFHSSQQMFITHTEGMQDSNAGVSDIAIHKGVQFRLVKLYPWEDYGYYKALGVRIAGE